jgi:hypothetical protein
MVRLCACRRALKTNEILRDPLPSFPPIALSPTDH